MLEHNVLQTLDECFSLWDAKKQLDIEQRRFNQRQIKLQNQSSLKEDPVDNERNTDGDEGTTSEFQNQGQEMLTLGDHAVYADLVLQRIATLITQPASANLRLLLSVRDPRSREETAADNFTHFKVGADRIEWYLTHLAMVLIQQAVRAAIDQQVLAPKDENEAICLLHKEIGMELDTMIRDIRPSLRDGTVEKSSPPQEQTSRIS
jgi:hypothetical protein